MNAIKENKAFYGDPDLLAQGLLTCSFVFDPGNDDLKGGAYTLRSSKDDFYHWQNGERIGAEKTPDKPADESAETGQENKDTKRKWEGKIEPKPPEILQKILWILKYGREHWKLVLLAILVLLICCIWSLLQ